MWATDGLEAEAREGSDCPRASGGEHHGAAGSGCAALKPAALNESAALWVCRMMYLGISGPELS